MQAGDVLGGRFELERPAGSGGMGEVFRAWDRATGEVVAIKVLLAERAADDARFAREAQILSELSHPGIVLTAGHISVSARNHVGSSTASGRTPNP